MCLAIPGKIVELVEGQNEVGVVEVAGVRRKVQLGLLAEDMPVKGDWVLIHVGFAMSKISESDAAEQMRLLSMLGEMDQAMEEVRGYGLDERSEYRRDRVGIAAQLVKALRPRRLTMRYVDEFRDPELITKAAEEIRRLADPARHYRIMEVCGGHTHAIYRFGLKDILPENIELIHGPGCPVCVLPMGRIDDGLTIARSPIESSPPSAT